MSDPTLLRCKGRSVPALAPAAPVVDTDRVRHTYTAVLGDPRTGTPHLSDDEQRAYLAGLLRGQMQLLLPAIEARLPDLADFNRSAAQHVIAKTRAALDVPVRGAVSAETLHDLATLTRALLALHEQAA